MKESNVKISVITVCFNAATSIEATIRSVIRQTYPNIEYIVIDGGSTDGTVDIIKRYSDKIDYWVSEPDNGIYYAMNKGIDAATGDYLNFMNAGDGFFNDDVVSKAVPMLDGFDFVAGIGACTEKGKLTYGFWKPVEGSFEIKDIINGSIVNHQACFIKKDIFAKIKYDPSYPIIADEIHFLQSIYLKKYRYKPIDLIVSRYDIDGISGNPDIISEIMMQRKDFYLHNIPEADFTDPQPANHNPVAQSLIDFKLSCIALWNRLFIGHPRLLK